MACGGRSSEAMTLPLLLILAALSAVAPLHSAAAPHSPHGPHDHHGLGASLGGGLGAGLGGRSLGELAESELERYAFLMLDPASSGGDSIPAGTVTRRITPKSVFIAPSVNNLCAEGHQQDDQGRCIKVVKVDSAKSWSLLLNSLNSQFAAEPSGPSPPPGPTAGPLHLAIPIEGVVPVPDPPSPASAQELPAANQTVSFQPGQENTTETDEGETTTPPATETETLAPATEAAQALIPEVVMLTSEEQPLIAVPVEQGSYLVQNDSRPGPGQPDAADVNPIINTVNSSPLVTGDLVEEVPPAGAAGSAPIPSRLIAEASNQLQHLLQMAFGASSTTSRPEDVTLRPPSSVEPSTSTTTQPPPSSSTTESPSASSVSLGSASLPEDSDESSEEEDDDDEVPPTTTLTPMLLESSTASSTTATPALSSTTPSTTTSTTTSTTASPMSSSTGSSSEESRPSSSNLLRPGSVPGSGLSSRIPVIAPEAVRFPTERPTLFRTQNGYVRFPSIDVTFPTSPGSALKADSNRLVDKPVAFPKDDRPTVWWPPLPAASSYVSNWGLEQTRTRPQQQVPPNRAPALHYHYRSRSPSRLSNGLGGANNLQTSPSSSSSSSTSSSSSSSSSSQESVQAVRRTLSHIHSRGPSHRRGREW